MFRFQYTCMCYCEVYGCVIFMKIKMTELRDETMAGPWIQNIYKDDDADENEEIARPVKLVSHDARRFTWWMSSVLKCSGNGIPAQAVQILERFLASYLRLDDTISTEVFEERRQALPIKLPLIVAMCVWLATKMSSASERRLNATIICIRLRQYAIHCTVKELTMLEMDIFRRINYRIPLWTTVEKANMLASVVGYSGSMLKTVEHLTNIAEILRDQVQDRVILIANKSTPDEGSTSTPALRNIRNGHYCAAVLLSMTTLSDYAGPPPDYVTQLLVKLTKGSAIYLKSIANAIREKLNNFVDNPMLPFKPNPLCVKRRYEDVDGQKKRPRILR